MFHKESASFFSEENNDELKKIIQEAPFKASVSVNRIMILLYWNTGQEILKAQQENGWGDGVMDQIAQDLLKEFPDMKGSSSQNLRYMKAFAEAYPDEQLVIELVAKIPWRYNCILLDKVNNIEQRTWYIRRTIENNWSLSVLERKIDNDFYQKEAKDKH